jgi:hypothetical protein
MTPYSKYAVDSWVSGRSDPVAQWIQELEAEASIEARLLLHRLRRDFVLSRYASTNLENLVSRLGAFLPSTVGDPPMLQFRKFHAQVRVEDESLLRNLGRPVDQSTWRGAGVAFNERHRFFKMVDQQLPSDAFRTPRERFLDRLGRAVGEASAPIHNLILEKLAHNDLSSIELGEANVRIRGNQGLLWVHRLGDLIGQTGTRLCPDNLKPLHRELAAAFRDGTIVAVFMPLAREKEEPPRTPTVFDAIESQLFVPASREDGWGQTVSLDKVASGLPEAVKGDTAWAADCPDPVEIGSVPVPSDLASRRRVERILELADMQLDSIEREHRRAGDPNAPGGDDET